MFLGLSVHNLDDKGRITLPNKDRGAFTDSIVFATIGFDGNIELYPQDAYMKMAEQYEQLSDFDANNRQLKRIFFSQSNQIEIDSHGRIQLSKPLLNKAGISKSVTFVGRMTHIELWDTDKFNELEKKGEDDYSCLAQTALKQVPQNK